MDNENNFSSYNNIKRLSDEEIVKVWEAYLADHDNKQLRDTLIVQYIYLTRYVVGRVKVALCQFFIKTRRIFFQPPTCEPYLLGCKT